ncbi:unnamed protein product, partial [Rotaria magnacalcarata]
MYVLQPKCQH